MSDVCNTRIQRCMTPMGVICGFQYFAPSQRSYLTPFHISTLYSTTDYEITMLFNMHAAKLKDFRKTVWGKKKCIENIDVET
jgi:hypothetical protein